MEFRFLFSILVFINFCNFCNASPTGALLLRDTPNCACADDQDQVDAAWGFENKNISQAIRYINRDLKKGEYRYLEGYGVWLTGLYMKTMEYIDALDCVSPKTVHALNAILVTMTSPFTPVYNFTEPPLRQEVFDLGQTVADLVNQHSQWINDQWEKNPQCAECLTFNNNYEVDPNASIEKFNCYLDYYGLGMTVVHESLCEEPNKDCDFYLHPPSSVASSSATPLPSSKIPESSQVPTVTASSPDPTSLISGSISTTSGFTDSAIEPTSSAPALTSPISQSTTTNPEPTSVLSGDSTASSEASSAPEQSTVTSGQTFITSEQTSAASEQTSLASGQTIASEQTSAASEEASVTSGQASVASELTVASEQISTASGSSSSFYDQSSTLAGRSSRISLTESASSRLSQSHSTASSAHSDSCTVSLHITSGHCLNSDSASESVETGFSNTLRESSAMKVSPKPSAPPATSPHEHTSSHSVVTAVTELTRQCSGPKQHCPTTLTVKEAGGDSVATAGPSSQQSISVSVSPGPVTPTTPANNGCRADPLWLGAVALVAAIL